MPKSVGNNAVVCANIDGKDYVYSFAGIDSTRSSSGIHLQSFKYDVENDRWTQIPDLPDTLGKVAASASFVNDKIYIIGGYHVFPNGSELSSSKVHIFDPQTDSYLDDGMDIPVPIDDQVQAVWNDSLIYVVTGWSQNNNVNNVQIYDPANDSWQMGTSVPNNSIYKVFGSNGTILNDTLYYFSGAWFTSNFPNSTYLRKGAINPDNPTEISWSHFTPDPQISAYRPACTSVHGKIFWIGGSNTTYNYDGIAYNGSGTVPPNNQSFVYRPSDHTWESDRTYDQLPMDLRGIAEISETTKIIAGGIQDGLQVSNGTLLLNWKGTTSIPNHSAQDHLNIYPNPTYDKIYIENGTAKKPFIIFDTYGRTVLSGEYYNKAITVSSLKDGMYFMWIDGKIGPFEIVNQ